jgi:FdrA protein
MSFVLNKVRRAMYLDSVALMRLSRAIAGTDGVEEAALMMGTPANHEIMSDAGVLNEEGESAGSGDLVIAIRATSEAIANAALTDAEAQLDAPAARGGEAEAWKPRTLRSAVAAMPDANLALISVPGAFAIAEARKAIRRGLNAMIFSDNVEIEDEAALKQEAFDLGRLVMGPDCGTSIIAGTPLAFANSVPSGEIGIVGASGTGIQEVSCLIAQHGHGISHAIGVGGRDLKTEVGGLSTLMALDALAEDTATRHIVLIAKPPGADVAARVLSKLAATGKHATVCFMGAKAMEMPENAVQVFTLQEAALAAMGQTHTPQPMPDMSARAGDILGLYAGGTLAAEAQVILQDQGLTPCSNAPIPGASDETASGHLILDLGEDTYTQGRPHPMIDPGVRDAPLIKALARDDLAAVLLDVVIGYGAHADPAGHLAEVIAAHRTESSPHLIASVTGTDSDVQNRAAQIARLKAAGVHVAPSNAEAVHWAIRAQSTP